MELSPATELRLFLICLLCGMVLGLLFDLFRVPRRLFATGIKLTLAQDLLYFFIAGGLTVYTLMSANSGILRGYEVLALFLGFLVYILLLSRVFLPILVKITGFFLWLAKKILFFLTFPLRIFAKPVIIMSVSLRHFLRKRRRTWSVCRTRLSRALLFLKKT